MRLLLILLMTALFGMLLTMATAPSEPTHTTTGTLTIGPGSLGLIESIPAGPVTLEHHNAITLEHHNAMQTESETDIACPTCGERVWKNLTSVLTSIPPQYRVGCRKCGWSGTCF